MPISPLETVRRYLDEHRPKERSLEGTRRYVDAMLAMEPVASDIRVESIEVGGIPAEVVTAPDADATRTLLYFHGGGFAFGSPRGYRPLTARLARAFGGRAVVVDYRLAPEHPFPAGADDCLAACRALLATLRDARRLVLAGDSAGGALVVATLVSLRDAGEPLPAAAALLSPWVDLEGTGESMTTRAALDPIVQREGVQILAQLYLGDRDRKNPRAAVTHANLLGLPPMLVQTGTSETQFDDTVTFADKLRAAGVSVTFEPWQDMIHVFQMFPAFPDAHRAVDRIGSFLRKESGG
jgi:epsilon-lactone hydrolase